MKAVFKVKNGLLVPIEVDAMERSRIIIENYVQHDLIQRQLPGFLQAILDSQDATIEAVVRQPSGLGRYTVLYRSSKQVDTEIYC
jgi:hypothetical protein